MKIKIATYNILHGYHKDQILENIETLIGKGADVICIQEAEIPLEGGVPPNWQVEYFHGELRGCHLALIWNTQKLDFIKAIKILLPISDKKSFLWRFTSVYNEKTQRGIFSASFNIGGRILRINNVHLSCEANTNHRIKQLEYASSILSKDKVDYEIFAGDFNTSAPLMFKRYQERRLEECFGKDYTNIFPNLKYTCNIVADYAPKDGIAGFKKFLKFLGIPIKSRLDYMFVRNLKAVSAEMFEWSGSDHRPLLAEFEQD